MQKVHGTYCALAAEHVQKRQSVEPSQRGCQNDDLKIRHIDTRPVIHKIQRQRPRIWRQRQRQLIPGMDNGVRVGRAQEPEGVWSSESLRGSVIRKLVDSFSWCKEKALRGLHAGAAPSTMAPSFSFAPFGVPDFHTSPGHSQPLGWFCSQR